MKHKNQRVSERLEDRHFTRTPASSSNQNKSTLKNSHISCLDLDLDLYLINGHYDYNVNLSISLIKIACMPIEILPYRSLRLQPCVRVCMNPTSLHMEVHRLRDNTRTQETDRKIWQ